MKPFLISWPIFYLVVFGVFFLTATFPFPGNDDIPDWVEQREVIKGIISNSIISPVTSTGSMAPLLAPAFWASLFAGAFAVFWKHDAGLRGLRETRHRG